MLPTELPKVRGEKPNGYSLVAWIRGHRPLVYLTFGSYSGEWVCLAVDDSDRHFYVYKGYYGSCSGCDSLEHDDPTSREECWNFAKDYPPFAEIPPETMKNLCERNTLKKVLPGNIREEGGDIAWEEVESEFTLAAALEIGVKPSIEDAFRTRNQELRRRAVDVIGAENIVGRGKTIHEDGENKLMELFGGVYLYLKDSSTPRRYLLRVPSDMQRVKQALAWSFNLPEHMYKPTVET